MRTLGGSNLGRTGEGSKTKASFSPTVDVQDVKYKYHANPPEHEFCFERRQGRDSRMIFLVMLIRQQGLKRYRFAKHAQYCPALDIEARATRVPKRRKSTKNNRHRTRVGVNKQ